MEGGAAEDGEAVDVTEVNFSGLLMISIIVMLVEEWIVGKVYGEWGG